MSSVNPYLLTQKQKWIMNEVVAGNVDPITGERVSSLDLDQLIERLASKYPDYAPSKQALQFSVRFLEKKGLLSKATPEKRRGRRRAVIAPSPVGLDMYSVFGSRILKSTPDVIVEDEYDDPEFNWGID